MENFILVGKLDAIPPGTAKSIDIVGKPVAVFNVSGRFYAVSDLCTHDMASLSEGTIENTEVECPWHGARFDLMTGKVLCMPATMDIDTYEVRIEDGNIFVSKNPKS
jgi:3-phenylpropionate/trans-cinnamate dioxygenase ferredoxin subunit